MVKKTTAKKPPAATPAKKVTPVAAKPEKVTLKPHQIVLSSNTQNAVSIFARCGNVEPKRPQGVEC